MVVTIDGPAGAGKTTLAEIIKAQLRSESVSVEIIHMDDLYDGWENPLGLKLSRALSDIRSQLSGKEITFPIYNWHEGKYSRIRSLASPKVLILEGVGSGHTAIREDVALSVWVDIEPRAGIERVIARDGSSVAPFMEKWLESQESHFLEHHTRQAADFTLVME